MNKEYSIFTKVFVVCNFITAFFAFPIGLGFFSGLLFFISSGYLIFDEKINMIWLLAFICSILFSILFKITIFFDKISQTKFAEILKKIYVTIDILTCVIYICTVTIQSFIENNYKSADTVSIIGFIFFAILPIVFILLAKKHIVCTVYDKKIKILITMYIIYLCTVPLCFFLTLKNATGFYYIAFHGILENIIVILLVIVKHSPDGQEIKNYQGTV